MADYLVIQVSDAANFPMSNPTEDIRLKIGFDGASPSLVDTRDGQTPGTRRAEIPAGAKTAHVSVESSNDTFWPADVDLTFVETKGPAQLNGAAALRQRHVLRVIAHKAGADWVTQVEIMVGQLHDIEATVRSHTHQLGDDVFVPLGTAPDGVNTKNNTYRPFFNSTISSNPAFRLPVHAAFRHIKAPWADSGTGDDMRHEPSWDARMACTRRDGASVGRLYLAERKNHPVQDHGPKLIAIWRPSFVEFLPPDPDNEKDFHGHGFHVFFHPFIGKQKKWDQGNFYDCARRYMFSEKGMVQQHYWTQRKVVFVMPVATDDVAWMGDLTKSWSAFDRFVHEVLFFMLNMENAQRPAMLTQFVNRIAVSGFSYGIKGVTGVLSNAPPVSRLREVYSFDGVDSPGRAPAFNGALLRWLQHAKTRDPLYFRIYTQDASPNSEGLGTEVRDVSDPKPVPQTVTVQRAWDRISQDSGAPRVRPQNYSVTTQEWESLTRTLLSMPHVAWQGLVSPLPPGWLNDDKKPMDDQTRFYGTVHQYIPEYFVYNAIDNSGFDK